MKSVLILIFSWAINLTVFSQDVPHNEYKNQTQVQNYTYAYVSVTGKAFSKRLNVEVDFGDTPQQIKSGKEYSEVLTNKKSYAAVLNYMAESQFELVETRDIMVTYQGTGEGSGIILIMRKKK